MRLFNETENTLLAEDVRQVSGLLSSMVGLIGKKKPHPIIFETRFGIHTFGMSFPIDVVILNSKNEVVSVKENLHPQGLFFWNPRYNKVLELPAGILKETKTSVGNRLIFS